MTKQELAAEVDHLMSEAMRLYDEGKSEEGDTKTSEAENLEDRWLADHPNETLSCRL